MLTYAQRSDYQCEEIEVPTTDNGVDWWYAFDNHSCGNDIDDGTGKVRYCQLSTDNAPDNLVVKKLRANREQVDNRDFLFWDGNYSWYIKPSIKIKVEDAISKQSVLVIIKTGTVKRCI